VADTLTVDLKASLHWLYQEGLDLSTVSDAARFEYAKTLVDGTSTDQADRLWHDQRTLSTGASENLDLTALASSLFGNSLTFSFVRVKALLIVNLATAANEDLAVGGAGSGANAWSAPFKGSADAKIAVPADSALLWVNKKNGWLVVDSSSDTLKIANDGSGSVSYRIAIVGTST
jgi:hypothetical protein